MIHRATHPVLAYLFTSVAAWSMAAPPAVAEEAAATAAQRVRIRCVSQADADACNDAIRRNPNDPVLLVALADALLRAKRPADAVRHYRRAAALAPHMPGLAAKLTAAEDRLASESNVGSAGRTLQSTSGKRYSNAAPETQSH